MDSSERILERSFYIGNNFADILYGLQLYMYFQMVWYILRGGIGTRHGLFYLFYGGALLILITFAMATNALFGQLMWIEHRDDPGGPAAYYAANVSGWLETLGSAADVTANFLGDGLLLYRCFTIWGGRFWIVTFPALLYLASTAMAIITVYQSALPGADIFQGTPVNFGVPWIVLTVTFNLVCTILICARILALRNSVRRALGPELTSTYTGIVSIMVESAAPFTILGIIFVVFYAKNLPSTFAFADVWGVFCGLSPQLIMLRVVSGISWTRDTVSRVTDPDISFTTDVTPDIGEKKAVESFGFLPHLFPQNRSGTDESYTSRSEAAV